MQFFKILFLLAWVCLAATGASSQTGRYETLDQDEAIRVFSAPLGTKIEVIRDGRTDVIVKNWIVIQDQPTHIIFEDLTLFRQLPGFITRDIRFKFGSANLTPSARVYLDELGLQILSSFEANPSLSLLIAGFTDAVGSAAYNLDLSSRRAASVELYLTRQFGLPSCLFNSVSYGEVWEGLLIKTKQANAINRRVEIRGTDVLQSATTGLPIVSCSRIQPQVSGSSKVITQLPLAIVSPTRVKGGHCNVGRIGTSLTLSFKGFNNSEFIGHLERMWPTLTAYKSHHLVESHPNLRHYSLETKQGTCETLDDVARHLTNNGYKIDDQVVLGMNGTLLTIEKL